MKLLRLLVLLVLVEAAPRIANAQSCVQQYCPTHGWVECGHFDAAPPPPPPPSPEELERMRKRREASEWNDKARTAADQGRWRDAIAAFEAAAALLPDDATIAENLARARDALERWEAEQKRIREEAASKDAVTSRIREVASEAAAARPVFGRIGNGATAADVTRLSACLTSALASDAKKAGVPPAYVERVRKTIAKLQKDLFVSAPGTPLVATLDDRTKAAQYIAAIGMVRDPDSLETRLDFQWHFSGGKKQPFEGQAIAILGEAGDVTASQMPEGADGCLTSRPSASLAFAGVAEAAPEAGACRCGGKECRCIREGLCGGTRACSCSGKDCNCAQSCRFAGTYTDCSGSHRDGATTRCNSTCQCTPLPSGCACTPSCACSHRTH